MSSRLNPNLNKNNSLSEKDFFDIVSINSKLSEAKVKKVWQHIRQTILVELQRGHDVTLSGLGTFKFVHREGREELQANNMGIKEKKYINSYDFVVGINEKNSKTRLLTRTDTDKYKENDIIITEDDYVDVMKDDCPTVLEVVHTLLNTKNSWQVSFYCTRRFNFRSAKFRRRKRTYSSCSRRY